MKYILISTLLLASAAQADCHNKTDCNDIKTWSDFTQFSAEYSLEKNGESTEFKYLKSSNELLVEVQSTKGLTTSLSIDGIGTLYKNMGETGFKTKQQCLSTIGDAYAILQGYALRAIYLIGVSSKGTPTNLDKKQNLAHKHQEGDSIVQIKPGYRITIGAPWNVSGTIEKQQEITYSIHHQHTVENEPQEMFIKGHWSDQPSLNKVDDNALLNDWLVCVDGVSRYENQEWKFEPYIIDTSNFTTVGQLRALIHGRTL